MIQKRSRSKPRFVGYVASSIDGRISLTKKSKPTWTSEEDWKFFQDHLAQADAVVVGRNTYEAAASRLNKRNTFVLTSSAHLTNHGSVTFVNPRDKNFASRFAGYKQVAVVGGSRVYQEMLDRGMLDELYVTIEPLVFGRGTSMFDGGNKNTRLTLVSIKKLNKKGTLLLRYKV